MIVFSVTAPIKERARVLGSWRFALMVLAVAMIIPFALSATPALAARGHVFETSFGKEGSGPGEFKNPAGIAVNEQTGDVYVVDAGNSRVQYFTPQGSFVGQFTGPSATGTGNLETGSATVSSVSTSSGAFVVGEELSATGVPSGTTITAVSGETLQLSAAAEVSGTGVGLTAHQSFMFHPQFGAIAVDNSPTSPSFGDVYVASGRYPLSVVDKFSSTGAFIGQIASTSEASAFEVVRGVAVDTTGKLFITEGHRNSMSGKEVETIDTFTDGVTNVFIPPSSEFHNVGESLSNGLAVDSEDDLYSKSSGFIEAVNESVLELSPNGTLLNGKLDPETEVTYNGAAVESSTNDVYVDNVTTVKRFTSAGVEVEAFGKGRLPSCGECQGGLAVNSATGRVYVGVGPGDVVQVWQLEPAGPPLIVGEWPSAVTSTSATFNAEVNPRSFSTEEPITYRFEYLDDAEYQADGEMFSGPDHPVSVPVPAASLPPSFEVDRLSVDVSELHPDTAYHFRLVAENGVSRREGKPAVGEAHTFTTRTSGVFSLPDGRQWELVSPPDKHGAGLLGIGSVPRSSVAGDVFAYQASSPTEAQPRGYSNMNVLAARGPSGWSSLDLEVPHSTPAGLGGRTYRFFSPDLSHALLQPTGSFEAALSPEASEQTAYLRTNYSPGSPGTWCASSCFHPLVTGKVGYANVPPGTVFGGEVEGECWLITCGPRAVGATSDLSHVALETEASLVEGAPQSLNGQNLYEWSNGRLVLVSQLPGKGGPVSQASLGWNNDTKAHAISQDGTRVFWEGGKTGRLYMRDTAHETTIEIGPVPFEGASVDGSKVFFAGKECEVRRNAGTGELECPVIHEGGEFLGASEDGAWAYYKSAGGVYVSHGGETKLVAPGVGLIGALGSGGAGSGPGGDPWRVSPNGRWLAFMSTSPLTGYDNRDALNGRPDMEVFLYRAETDGADRLASGKLVCASCNPTGVRPHGVEYEKMLLAGAGEQGIWPGGTWVAANVPAPAGYNSHAVYESRYLSDSGRLFFNSPDALVTQDVNGTVDVYEFEPAGVGGCTSATASGSVVYVSASGGCVGLISSGESPEESAFLDASESGGDVFFLSSAKLSSLDVDGSLSLFDAHECSASSPCLPAPPAAPAPCETEASCKGSPTSQPTIFGAGASETFNGAGNPVSSTTAAVTTKTLSRTRLLAKALRSCRRDRSKRKRVVCERGARRRYGAVPARSKTSSKRRGK